MIRLRHTRLRRTRLRRTRIRRAMFYSQQGKCIYQNSVSTYCSKLSVELSILVV